MSNKNFLVIFPTAHQTSLIGSLSFNSSTIYVISKTVSTKTNSSCSNVAFISSNDKDYIQYLKLQTLYVLCCHEEAIYWLSIHHSPNWILQFDPIYLSLLEKQDFKSFVLRNHIQSSSYELTSNDISSFPVIAKPSIGFGSIGVKLLRNMVECEDYVHNFQKLIENSSIFGYQKKYFPKKNNQYIFETPIKGTFYRTPFTVQSKKCIQAFPIRGITRHAQAISDYHWVEFDYSPSHDT